MPTYLIQVTPEGGPDGCKVVEGDYFEVVDCGIVVHKDGKPVFAVSDYCIAVDLDEFASIEAATAALFTEEPTE